MPENIPPAPRRPGWKSAAPAGAERDPRGGWRQDARREDDRRGRRWLWTFAAIPVMAALAVAFVWVAKQARQPETVGIVLIGAPYEHDTALPANYYGWRGLLDLKQLAESSTRGGGWFGLRPRFRLLQKELQPATAADGLLPDPGNEDTTLIFVSLHGGADDQGPYLFLDNPAAFAADPAKARVRVADLLNQLADGKWQSKKKIVAFDATQLSSCWERGVLRNDFVAELKKLLESRRDADLAVLCSSDAGQRSWQSVTWQQTAFTHFLIDGINGKADGAGPSAGTKDTRVRLQELAAYVTERVTVWANGHRSDTQTPVLLLGAGTAADRANWELDLADEVTLPETAQPDFTALRDAWGVCDELRKLEPWLRAYAPQLWKLYLDTLMRYEQAVLSGCTAEAGDLKDKLAKLKGRLELEAKLTFPDEALTAANNAFPVPDVYGPAPPTPQRLKELRQQLANLSEGARREPLDEFANAVRGGEPRPAEVHLARMIAKDLAPAAGGAKELPATLGKAVTQAVGVRLLAEQAALSAPAGAAGDLPTYAEAIFPRVRKKVTDGDEARRRGEDLLFASEERYWNESLKHLSEARSHYDAACKDAETLRAAFEARDRALAELPYYGSWMVDAPPDFDGKEGLKTSESIWDAAHKLSGLLADPKRDASLSETKKLTGVIQAGFPKLAVPVTAYWQQFASNAAVTQQRLRQLDSALRLPFIPAGDRAGLLRQRWDAAGKLLELQAATAKPGVPLDPSADEARLGQAVLGRALPPSQQKLLDDGQVGEPGRAMSGDWRDAANEADNDLGKSLRSRTLADATTLAAKASAAQRPLDSSAALASASPCGAAKALRRLQAAELVRWQAERTEADHWFNENGEPWYVGQAQLYLNDARTLAASGLADKPPSDAQRRKEIPDKVERTDLGKPEPSGRLPVLTKHHAKGAIRWAVQAPKGESVGDPVFWVERSAPLDPGRPDREPPESRADRDNRLPAKPGELSLNAETIPENLESVGVRLKGYYRGQQLNNPVDVPVEAEPEVRTQRFPPRGVAFKVVPKDVIKGHLAVVLDGSASMGTTAKYSPTTPCKYHTATQALRRVLDRLPNGTTISVRRFGQNAAGKTEIRRVIDPVLYRRDNAELMAELDALDEFEPKEGGSSPVVQSMVEALTEELAKRDGVKALLVLTDGQDNNFVGDVPGHLTAKFLDSGVAVRIVLIVTTEKDREELPNALRQFNCVKEFSPSGDLVPLNEATLTPGTTDRLRDTIEDALIPRVELRQNRRLIKVDGLYGLPILPMGSSRKWGGADGQLRPDTYEVRTYGLSRSIRLNEGDRLLLGLRQDEHQRLRLGRLLVADELGPSFGDRRFEAGDWVAAALWNKYEAGGRLQQILSLERRPDAAASTIEQVQPGYCWIEVDDPPGTGSPGRLTVQRDYEFPAPAFRVRRTKWPQEATPRVHVWRRDALPEGSETRKFDLVRDNVPVTAKIGGRDVTLERVHDSRSVEVAPSGARETKRCLVLNVTSPKGHRVMALPVGDATSDGEEHCYYGRGEFEHYEAIFWNDDLPSLPVRLVALNDFKKDVEPINLNLDRPRDDDRRLFEPVLVGARPADTRGAAPPPGGK